MQDTGKKESFFEDTQIAFSHVTDKELQKAFRLFQAFNKPMFLAIGKIFANVAFQLRLPVKGIFKKTIYHHFCGGETLEECKGAIKQLTDHKICTTLQYSVETKSNEEEFNYTTRQLVDAINYAGTDNNIKAVSCKLTGIGSLGLFEKLNISSPLSGEETQAFEQIRSRMDTISSAAEKAGVSIFFDAEESWIQLPMDELTDEMMLKYNKKRAIVYNTFQLYRTDRLDFLKASFQNAKANNIILGAKLVRGAYMEKERERAKLMGYPSPIYPDKLSVDRAYDDALEFCLDNIENISLFAATHNEQSCHQLADVLSKKNLNRNHPNVFLSQLYGMGDHLTYNLAKEGFNAVKLLPYGPVREAIPYLIRRAEENSSIAGQVGRELQLLAKEKKRRGLS